MYKGEVIMGVEKRDNEDIESMIKRFKRKVNKSGILKDLKKTEFYDKPSVAKRKKRNEARKRLIREAQKKLKYKTEKKDGRDERTSSNK